MTARTIILALKQKLKGRKSKKELRAIADEYLRVVKLENAGGKYPGQMSGGMQQRAAIARALAFGSDLLLMDEPFGALDPLTRLYLQDFVKEISQKQKVTIVFVTHDTDEAIYLADRIVVFSPGAPGMGGTAITTVENPFSKAHNRKKLLQSNEFATFRDSIIKMMNQRLLENLANENRIFS